MASTFEALLLAQVSFLLNKPRFKGSILAATALTTSTNINYTTVSEDSYGAWNATNHNWVVPVAGLYFFTAQFKWGSTTPSSGPGIQVRGGAAGTSVLAQSQNAPSIGAFGGFGFSGYVRGAVGDLLAVQLTNSGFTTQVDGTADNNYFELFFVSL